MRKPSYLSSKIQSSDENPASAVWHSIGSASPTARLGTFALSSARSTSWCRGARANSSSTVSPDRTLDAESGVLSASHAIEGSSRFLISSQSLLPRPEPRPRVPLPVWTSVNAPRSL
jgi:hypothetical protein